MDATELDLLTRAFDSMRSGPRSLTRVYGAMADIDGLESVLEEQKLAAWLETASLASPVRMRVARALIDWDAAEGLPWVGGTARNTVERRSLVYETLEIEPLLRQRLDDVARVVLVEPPVVVATAHTD